MVSAIWSPTVYAGFRLVIGSWKIIDMRSPRTSSRCRFDNVSRSTPSSLIEPDGMRPGGCGMSPMTAIDVTVLPEPDSPTIPTVSWAPTWNDTSWTTVAQPVSVRKSTVRLSTVRIGSRGSTTVASTPSLGSRMVAPVSAVVVVTSLTSLSSLRARWSPGGRLP
jgi:hypothetical protein